MLQVNQLIGFGVGGALASVVFGSTQTGTTTGDPFQFTAMTLGVAASNRVCVAALSYSVVGSDFADSVTIGGVTAIKVAAAGNGAVAAELWAAVVPTGTTGDMVFSGFGESGPGGTAMGCSTYSIYDTSSATPTSTGADNTSTFDVALGVGAAIGVYAAFSDADTVTWTNLTEDADVHAAEAGTDVHHGAAHTRLNAATTATVTPTGGVNNCFAAAAWGP